MITSVLFIQGAGAGTHDEWDDELAASLERELGEGFAVHYPRMPNEDDPRYSTWSTAIVDEIERLGPGVMLVGHSVGAAILVHTIAQYAPTEIGGLFLVAAPFIGEGGWPSEDIEPRTDFSESFPSDLPVHLYHGLEDETVPSSHLRLYAEAIPQAIVRPLAGRDHQLANDMTEVARDIRSVGTASSSNGGTPRVSTCPAA